MLFYLYLHDYHWNSEAGVDVYILKLRNRHCNTLQDHAATRHFLLTRNSVTPDSFESFWQLYRQAVMTDRRDLMTS